MNNFSLTRQDTQVMKGIAIIAMLCHHLYSDPELRGIVPYDGIYAWLGALGKVCVALFLFCSGYGLSKQYEQKSIKDDIKFIVKRLLKFYANYWVIFLIFVPISVFMFHRPLSAAYGEHVNIIKRLVLDFMGLQGYLSYNITWWFNKLIIILYILFPLLYRIVNYKPWLALIFSMLIVVINPYIVYNPLDILTYQSPFVVGMLWQQYEDKWPNVCDWLSEHMVVFASITCLFLIAVVSIRMFCLDASYRYDAFLAIAMSLTLISSVRYMNTLANVLAFLGKHSMNIYMTHTFINGYWRPEWLHGCEGMRGGGNFLILALTCVLMSVVIEYVKKMTGIYKLQRTITNRI